MANIVSENFKKVTNNPIGALAGVAVGFFAAKKMCKEGMKYRMVCIGVSAIAGAVIGAMIQSKMKAKAGAPTKDTVKK